MKFDRSDIPTMLILHQLLHLSGIHAMHMLGKYDLKPGQAGILFILDKNKGLSQRELAEFIGVKPPSITVALQKMEKKGFLERELDKQDQRIMRLRITQQGRECIINIKRVVKEMDEILCADMNSEEKILVRRLLLQMRHNLTESKVLEDIKVCIPMEHL
ncbi:MAG: MarR family transcriptional regulator [Lachnospiraceae bacterium]